MYFRVVDVSCRCRSTQFRKLDFFFLLPHQASSKTSPSVLPSAHSAWSRSCGIESLYRSPTLQPGANAASSWIQTAGRSLPSPSRKLWQGLRYVMQQQDEHLLEGTKRLYSGNISEHYGGAGGGVKDEDLPVSWASGSMRAIPTLSTTRTPWLLRYCCRTGCMTFWHKKSFASSLTTCRPTSMSWSRICKSVSTPAASSMFPSPTSERSPARDALNNTVRNGFKRGLSTWLGEKASGISTIRPEKTAEFSTGRPSTETVTMLPSLTVPGLLHGTVCTNACTHSLLMWSTSGSVSTQAGLLEITLLANVIRFWLLLKSSFTLQPQSSRWR